MAETKTRTIHLMHASMRFDRPDSEFKQAIRWQMDQEPDIISYTEVTRYHQELREVTKGTNYRPVLPRGREGGFLVRVGENCHVKDQGSTKIMEGRPGPASQGGFADRYCYWVKVKWYGEDVFQHVQHWTTGYYKSDLRDRWHENMTKVMVDNVKKHGKGFDIAFFAGDQNVDEQADNNKTALRSQMDGTFRDNGLLTIWDEMQVFPPTHGLNHGPTIDIIGSYNPDKRVKAKRWKVYQKHASDHRPISAWYEVSHVKKASVGGSTGGGSTNPTPKKGFIHGGNVDFSDYADGRIYDLPTAIDDSDLTNG